jgi:hypothetical protein
VPGPLRLIGHGEAAPSASLEPAALQGRALKVACDDDWVFDKNGKTETSRFTLFLMPFPIARFYCMPASSCIFSLFSPREQGRTNERPKERPRPNRQPHAEAAAAVAATVAAACRPKPGAGIQQGASLLIFCAFTGAAKVPGVHVHVEHI